MLDVHPPEHTPHSWRDFFIHIATIVVGLLIAVALEQSVEFVHRRHERAELRRSLMEDAREARLDAESVHVYTGKLNRWLALQIDAVQDAIVEKQVLQPGAPYISADFLSPASPAWDAAKSSGAVEVLTQEDIKDFSEIEFNVAMAERYHVAMNDSVVHVLEFRQRFERHGSNTPDYSWASSEDLKEYLKLLLEARSAARAYALWCRYLHGAETSVLGGERDLKRIEAAELNPW